MPFLSAGFTNPEPPVTMTSPDGILTATVDGAGVLLCADFDTSEPEQVVATNLVSNPDGTTASYWGQYVGTGGSTTLSAGSGYIEQAWTVAPTSGNQGLQYSYTSTLSAADPNLTAAPGDYRSTSFQVWVNRAMLLRFYSRFNPADSTTPAAEAATPLTSVSVPANTWTTIKMNGNAAAPSGTARMYLFLLMASGSNFQAGDILRIRRTTVIAGQVAADPFAGNTPAAGGYSYRWTGTAGASTSQKYVPAVPGPDRPIERIRFTRAPDTLVRSGDDAWASAFAAYAYDFEAPLGASSTWFATPVYADGTTGTPSQGVAVTLPGVAASMCWLKSVADPNLSVLAELVLPLPTITRQARMYLSEVQGAPLPAGGFDRHTQQPLTVSVYTDTVAERDALYAVVDSGVVLFQTQDVYGIPDFYALVGDTSESYAGTGDDASRIIELQLQPVNRPTPRDAWITIPGNTVGDLARDVATVADVPVVYPTVGALVEAQ